MRNDCDFSVLKGKTLIAIEGEVGDDVMTFKCSDGTSYQLYHYQDCCENVSLDDICGDLNHLIGSPLLEAEEACNEPDPDPNPNQWDESFTWTFYKLGTVNGHVTLRWYGSSNGYYSERVDFKEITR